MKTIAIITCYIGTFPSWFQLWLNSCEFNSTIDFFVYTDQDVKEYKVPTNVIIKYTTLDKLKESFSVACGMNLELNKPYKLCDYKPLYGLAFQQDVSKYDFWGHCDVDLIFGDLRNFIKDDILENYDKVFEVGHLSLYRNCKEMNEAYKHKGALFEFEQVAKTNYYCGYDEHTGMIRIMHKHGFKMYSEVVCADIDPHYRAFYMMDEDTLAEVKKVSNSQHQIFVIENGKVYRYFFDETIDAENIVSREEVSYVHFMRKYPVNAMLCEAADKYIITYKEFIPISGVVDEALIRKYDYSVQGFLKFFEYMLAFIGNGVRALKKGELLHRIKLRIHRIKTVNKIYVNR